MRSDQGRRRGISRREMLRWSGLSAGMLVLSACVPVAAPTGETETQGSAAPAIATTQVTMWHGWTGADNTEMLDQIINSYNQTNEDGIVLTPTAYAWDEFFSKWVLASASGSPPDIALYHPTEIPEFVERGTVIPLDDLAETGGWTWEGIPDSVREQCYYNGQLYGIIEDYHPLGMFYNIDLVEKAGLDPDSPPTNRDEFLEWAQAMTIKDANGNFVQSGASMPTTGIARWIWHSWLHQNGGRFLNEDGSVAFNDDAGSGALQMMHDIIHEYGIAPIGQNIGEDFRAGVLGILFNGPWNVNSFLNAELNFATAPLPTVFEQPAAWANSHCLSLSKTDSTERQVASMKFISWFARNNLEAALKVGIIPAATDVLDQMKETDRWQYYKAFADQAEYLAYEPMIPQYSQIFSFEKPTPLTVNLEAALTNAKTIPQALADMQAGVAEILATPIGG
jgi:multiple sugar transport system substrate-binding protein